MFGKNKALGSPEYLIVGLGNPDKKYENTRHNTGWLALDYIADKYGCKINKVKYKSFVGNCTIGKSKVLLMKPATYMNNSGSAFSRGDFSRISIRIPSGFVFRAFFTRNRTLCPGRVFFTRTGASLSSVRTIPLFGNRRVVTSPSQQSFFFIVTSLYSPIIPKTSLFHNTKVDLPFQIRYTDTILINAEDFWYGALQRGKYHGYYPETE